MCVGADGSARPLVFLSLFLFCLRRVTFVSSDKSNQKRHLRKGGFRFPPFLKNPFPLKRPKGRAAALPFGSPSRGVWAIIKSRLCRKAAKVGGAQGPLVDMKRKRIPTGASRPRNDREKTGRTLGRRSIGADDSVRPEYDAKTAGRCTPRVLVPLRSTAWASPPTDEQRGCGGSTSFLPALRATSLAEGGRDSAPAGAGILARS